MAKTVDVQLTFSMKNPANVEELKRVIKAISQQDEATALLPQFVAASLANVQLSLGGVSQAKWLLIETDQEVTIKLNQSTDTGFQMTGVMLVQSQTGITAVFVTTGPNVTTINMIAVGV